jgi:hypothetical protein
MFSIMLPIISPYRLTSVSLYRHLYTKYIWITYNITYKGSLYFGIQSTVQLRLVTLVLPDYLIDCIMISGFRISKQLLINTVYVELG